MAWREDDLQHKVISTVFRFLKNIIYLEKPLSVVEPSLLVVHRNSDFQYSETMDT